MLKAVPPQNNHATNILVNQSLLARLLAHGSVAIEAGRLVVIPHSGKPVPQKWLDENGPSVVSEILKELDADAYYYLDYSVGKHGESLSSGLTLHFKSAMTGANLYAIFNVELKRLRATKNGKVGGPLPKGKFNVPKRGAFLDFWESSGALGPKSDTEFHKYLGNLKPIFFTGQVNYSKAGKLINGTLKPLNMTAKQVAALCKN